MKGDRYEKWDETDRANYQAYKEAQDRISTLEAALRGLLENGRPHHEEYLDQDSYAQAVERYEIARKALEQK